MVENILGKGENAGYQHFLLFPQCFQEVSCARSLKVRIVLKRIKYGISGTTDEIVRYHRSFTCIEYSNVSLEEILLFFTDAGASRTMSDWINKQHSV